MPIDSENTILCRICDEIAAIEAKSHSVLQDIRLLQAPNLTVEGVYSINAIEKTVKNIIKLTQEIIPERIELESSLIAEDDEPDFDEHRIGYRKCSGCLD